MNRLLTAAIAKKALMNSAKKCKERVDKYGIISVKFLGTSIGHEYQEQVINLLVRNNG